MEFTKRKPLRVGIVHTSQMVLDIENQVRIEFHFSAICIYSEPSSEDTFVSMWPCTVRQY